MTSKQIPYQDFLYHTEFFRTTILRKMDRSKMILDCPRLVFLYSVPYTLDVRS